MLTSGEPPRGGALPPTILGLGSGLYLSAGLGPGPRDGWMTGIHRATGLRISPVRGGIEVAALAGGWLLGGTAGVGTVAFALLIGPAVGTVLRLLGRPGATLAVHRHLPSGLPHEPR